MSNDNTSATTISGHAVSIECGGFSHVLSNRRRWILAHMQLNSVAMSSSLLPIQSSVTRPSVRSLLRIKLAFSSYLVVCASSPGYRSYVSHFSFPYDFGTYRILAYSFATLWQITDDERTSWFGRNAKFEQLQRSIAGFSLGTFIL
jgi:hypothetical protein